MSIEPTFDEETGIIRIPRIPGASHYINGEKVRGSVQVSEPTTVTAEPNPGSHFREGTVTEWEYFGRTVDDDRVAPSMVAEGTTDVDDEEDD